MNYILHYVSPLGGITLAGDGEFLTGLWFDGQQHFPHNLTADSTEAGLPVFAQTVKWLDTYFSGKNLTSPRCSACTQHRFAGQSMIYSSRYLTGIP